MQHSKRQIKRPGARRTVRPWQLGRRYQRSEDRTRVDWEAWTSLGGIRLGGRLRDVSDGGAFFEPRSDMSEPGLLETIRRQRPLIERNDDVVLSYSSAIDEPRHVLATVRWMGPSRKHGCFGLGIQFAAEESA